MPWNRCKPIIRLYSLQRQAPNSGDIVRKGTTVKLASLVAPDADDQQILHQVASYYRQTLKDSPEALGHL